MACLVGSTMPILIVLGQKRWLREPVPFIAVAKTDRIVLMLSFDCHFLSAWSLKWRTMARVAIRHAIDRTTDAYSSVQES